MKVILPLCAMVTMLMLGSNACAQQVTTTTIEPPAGQSGVQQTITTTVEPPGIEPGVTTIIQSPGNSPAFIITSPNPVVPSVESRATNGEKIEIDSDDSVYEVFPDGARATAPDGMITLINGKTITVKDGKRIP